MKFWLPLGQVSPQLMFVGSAPLPRPHSFAATRSELLKVWLFSLTIICAFGAIPRNSGCVAAMAPATRLACPPPEPMFLPLGQSALTAAQ